MKKNIPNLANSAIVRLSLSLARLVYGVGSFLIVIAGLLQVMKCILHGDIVVALLFLLATLVGFFLSVAFFAVFTATSVFLSSQEFNATQTFAVECENGHCFEATKAQAGSSIPCKVCGRDIKIPSLSDLQRKYKPPAAEQPRFET